MLRGGSGGRGGRPHAADESGTPSGKLVRLVIFFTTAWPLILLAIGYPATSNDPMSGNAFEFGWRVWVVWIMLSVAAIAAVAQGQYSNAQQSRMVAVVLGMFAGLIALKELSTEDDITARLNQKYSDYQYTMPVTRAPSSSPQEVWFEVLTPHARAQRLNFRNAYGDYHKLTQPCLDVHLGVLGGYFATPPYECGTRPGRRMANTADLMLAPFAPSL